MNFGICMVPAAPVRKEPAHQCEMTSQLLFGETVEVLDERDEWRRVSSLYDGYEGWITYHVMEEVEKKVAHQPVLLVSAGLLNKITTPEGTMHIPMGCSLAGLNKTSKHLWNESYLYEGAYHNMEEKKDDLFLETAARLWLNAPYLWGGKTLMGVDCSGFIQTVFKAAGMPLKRDACEQAQQGKEVKSLAEARKGDVAFFANKKGKIIHVGLLLSPVQIIHASGKVRIDNIDEQGIVTAQGKRTHSFHSIKRML